MKKQAANLTLGIEIQIGGQLRLYEWPLFYFDFEQYQEVDGRRGQYTDTLYKIQGHKQDI